MPVGIRKIRALFASKESEAALKQAREGFDRALKASAKIQALILKKFKHGEPITLDNVTSALQQALICAQAAYNVQKQLAALKKPNRDLKYTNERTKATTKSAEKSALILVDNYIAQELYAIQTSMTQKYIDNIVAGVQLFVRQQLRKGYDEYLKTGRIDVDIKHIIQDSIAHAKDLLTKTKKLYEPGTRKKQVFGD